MTNNTISNAVKSNLLARVEAFNQKNQGYHYVPKFKGKFVYLLRKGADDQLGPICRLSYNGKINEMDFAIFKYSSETYDPNEFFFPGQKFVDGTIEGAMKAGIAAYPD